MKARLSVSVAAFVGALILVIGVTAVHGQNAAGSKQFTPKRLADGQPDIQGMWNNEEANFTPLELPDELSGRTSFTKEELQKLAESRRKASLDQGDQRGKGDPGFYSLYWFDWYWRNAAAGDWPALLVEPKTGKLPALTPEAKKVNAYVNEHLHDTYTNIESGDRCISRGVFGMMLPTAYNNAKLILQSPGYVVIHSEMIHNARVIPVDGRPHLGQAIRNWEGDPRGRWEGNTLIVESTNFKAVDNMRAAGGRARQTERRRITEKFTVIDANTLKYSVSLDDPTTYTAPWTISYPYTRDSKYQQFEYACHEGNWAVSGALAGARAEERARSKPSTKQ